MKYKVLYWIPRILGIVYILFISLFALDAFYGKSKIGYEILSFLVHMIPSFILAIILIIAWKRELVGGLLFLLTGIIFTFAYTTFQTAPSFLCISCPLILVGILFLIESVLKKKTGKI